MADLDEFGEIARLFRPLTGGAPEALALLDDAALIAPPPGEDLVVSTDTIVEGVHFLAGTPPGLVARRLLRANLSDLAAKAAAPWGWLLNIAWPPHYDGAAREAFAAGLAEDQAAFGLSLWGGDTVRTPGPLIATATLVGRVPAGAMVRRGGARVGDVVLVSGTIGDAGLGLDALKAVPAPLEEKGSHAAALIARHRLPEPRLRLRDALRTYASAAADVSDGLLADAGRIALASGIRALINIDRAPLSREASAWLAGQSDPAAARIRLVTSGDDYEVVCTARPSRAEPLCALAASAGVPLTPIGVVAEGEGVEARFGGRTLDVQRLGWTHGEGAA